VAGDDLADHAGLGGVVAEDPALQLAGGDALLDQGLGVVGEGGGQAGGQLVGVLTLEMPIEEPSRAGLVNTG
jgi:hypothetical protein